MLAEICLISLGTVIAIFVMFVHSQSAFDEDVPRLLLIATFLCNKSDRKSEKNRRFLNDINTSHDELLINNHTEINENVKWVGDWCSDVR